MTRRSAICAKKKDHFFNAATLHIKIEHFVPRCYTEQKVVGSKNVQACNMSVLQRYSNAKSTYISVIIIFVLGNFIIKTQI